MIIREQLQRRLEEIRQQVSGPRAPSSEYEALLFACAFYGDDEGAELLLEKGVSVKNKDTNGYTPLHRAAHGGHLSLVKLFLDRGADINALNDEEHTPLDSAESTINTHQEQDEQARRCQEVRQYLLEHGAIRGVPKGRPKVLGRVADLPWNRRRREEELAKQQRQQQQLVGKDSQLAEEGDAMLTPARVSPLPDEEPAELLHGGEPTETLHEAADLHDQLPSQRALQEEQSIVQKTRISLASYIDSRQAEPEYLGWARKFKPLCCQENKIAVAKAVDAFLMEECHADSIIDAHALMPYLQLAPGSKLAQLKEEDGGRFIKAIDTILSDKRLGKMIERHNDLVRAMQIKPNVCGCGAG